MSITRDDPTAAPLVPVVNNPKSKKNRLLLNSVLLYKTSTHKHSPPGSMRVVEIIYKLTHTLSTASKKFSNSVASVRVRYFGMKGMFMNFTHRY